MMTQRQQPDDPWEAALDRAIKHLPDRKAPPTLLPRVRDAIDARAGVRLHRPLWHIPAQIAATATVLAAMLWLGAAIAGMPSPTVWARVGQTISDALALALGSLVPSGTQMALTCAAILLSAMYLTCIGLGSAVVRVARSS